MKSADAYHLKLAFFPFLLVFFEVLTYLSSDMYLPALPSVMHDLSLTSTQTQLTLTSWFLGAVSMQLILGPLSDRFGRKIILSIGAVLFATSTFICATAENFHIFLIARFLQGTSICFMAVPGYAAIHELFEQAKAIKILALMASISVLAPALGPLAGSVIMLLGSWQWIFILLAMLACLSAILLIIFMPETLPNNQRHALEFGNVLKTYYRIFSNLRFMLTVTTFGLIFCGFITWITAGPFVVINQFHSTPFMFSLCQGFIFLSNIIANQFVKRYVDKVGANKLVQIGIPICFSISIISVIFTFLLPNVMSIIILTYVIYSFGSGLTFSSLNRLTIETSNEPMGSRMAVFSTVMSGFAALASILVTLFYHGTTFSLAAILFIVILLSFFLNQTNKMISKK